MNHAELASYAQTFAADHPAAIGYTLSPTGFRMFHASDLAGEPEDWYLLRLFDADSDLTAEKVPGGPGRAELLTDATAKDRGWRLGPSYQRILWGVVNRPDGRYAVLRDAQTARLRVPVTQDVPPKRQLVLTAVEYLALDEHGNASVVAERLTGIDVMKEN